MTTSTPICPHDGDPYSCPPCQSNPNDLDNFLASGPPRTRQVFPAKYDGYCHVCEDGIFPDEPATYDSDGFLIHASHEGLA